ncbi:hypothetical protein A2U01_0112730, partial [Trifolium medium]|nr:hypothetical protein [Trifolium medium]
SIISLSSSEVVDKSADEDSVVAVFINGLVDDVIDDNDVNEEEDDDDNESDLMSI